MMYHLSVCEMTNDLVCDVPLLGVCDMTEFVCEMTDVIVCDMTNRTDS